MRYNKAHLLPMLMLPIGLLLQEASTAHAQAPTAEHSHDSAHAEAAPAAEADAVPLFDNLGTHHYPIQTRSEEAQKYFDQGLRLTYGFNHAEAIRAFREAARLDPDCAMCFWGMALAYGPNINFGMDSLSGAEAYAAIQEAIARKEHASERERAFIDALATRYANPPPADRAALDSAYAEAMAGVVSAYPDDHEAATLLADATMNLSPWYYWEHDGTPRPDTPTILSQLERVIEQNPNHPGACHFYIHAVEAAQPEKGVACAERLAALMPGAGHLVHMPAHIYIRVGRWNDAIDANRHAVHTDESYIADYGPTGVYPAGYYPHNYHFLAFAASMAGRSAETIEAARSAASKVPPEVALLAHEMEGIVAYHHLALVTFGKWDAVLDEPMPPQELTYANGLVHYARGVAYAATGRFEEAQRELVEVRARSEAVDGEPGNTVLNIAEHALQGEIAGRGGDPEAAIAHFEQAKELEDSILYTEPPYWYYPIRHSLGAVLLQAGRPADAERVYREDLVRFPENGWSLYGLAQSLRAQGKEDEATEVEGRLQRSWDRADLTIASSRL